FSVDKYFELQEKKLELEAKKRAGAAKTAMSSMVHRSSRPTVISPWTTRMESLKTRVPHLPSHVSPSLRLGLAAPVKVIRTLHLRSVSDAVPSTLEALAIASDPPTITPDPPVVPSEQHDAPRTDDSVRDPWIPSESVISTRYRRTVPPNVIPLYVDSRIVDDAEAASKHFEPMTNQRRDYYISLFHELRYWSSKKTSGRSRVPEWQALCQIWNQFVKNFNKDSTAYRNPIASARGRFMKYSVTSVVQRVHEGSMNVSIPCAVPVGIHCSHCPPAAPRISERDLTGYTTNRVPANVKELRAKLAGTRQHPSVMPEHNTPRNTAPRSDTNFSNRKLGNSLH
ncbi:hypothetical protein PHMEG_00021172, partial [Phytophthora megakarya]